MPSRCFCFQQPFSDSICNLADFGEIVNIFGQQGRPSIYDDRMDDAIKKRLLKENFDVSEDFIVVVRGNVAGICRLVAVASAMHSLIRVLMFNDKINVYEESTMGVEIEETKHA